ncbi:Hypothetical protein PHPALM_16345 [Phytophthora palmivora]|uniref:Uncharacterized protein n=1 Tax=Phytophthora palmivora TaxID=4796 RepID=A0A2P4XPY8_9STRA|nr:Hypothetical protein PHPALM_16345 [Phytophthora palmivora]
MSLSVAGAVSRLWSAKGDERCDPPRSDDYKDWSLMQLKREITQRQLKTNPRRRNKDAFVRVLLASDQEQAQQTQAQNQQQTLDDPVLFVPTSTSELQNIYINNGDQQNQDMYGSHGGQQPQQQDLYNGTQQQQEVYIEPQQQQEPYVNTGEQQNFMTSDVNVGVMQATPLAPSAPLVRDHVQEPAQISQAPVADVATVASVTSESEVETPQCFQDSKRQKVDGTGQESEGGENANSTVVEATRPGNPIQVGKGSTEYLRRKLSIQAARLEIESRRLDLETKREQRNSELHAVQLALAKEQLQQAKLTTQKMKTEWMVEQMIQKKRLNDAGISQEDSSALGMYLS